MSNQNKYDLPYVTVYTCPTCYSFFESKEKRNDHICRNMFINLGVQMDGQPRVDGKKFDEGKPMWDLLPYDAVEGAVKILTKGAVKYGSRNWENGLAYGRVYGALQRHLTAWWMASLNKNDGKDLESGQSHLDHALCELLFLMAYEKRNMTSFDDRPK